MKRFPTLTGFTLLTALLAGTARADLYLKDASEIVGVYSAAQKFAFVQ